MEVDSLVKDHQDDINKLAERGSVVLSDLIDDAHLIETGWMVVKVCDGVGPSEPVQTQTITSSSSFSSDDNKIRRMEECDGDDEEVDITRDLDVAGEDEEGLEGS